MNILPLMNHPRVQQVFVRPGLDIEDTSHLKMQLIICFLAALVAVTFAASVNERAPLHLSTLSKFSTNRIYKEDLTENLVFYVLYVDSSSMA